MAARKIFNDPDHLRECAEEARALAEFMSDAGARNTMFEVAAAYDQMAERVERARQSETKQA